MIKSLLAFKQKIFKFFGVLKYIEWLYPNFKCNKSKSSTFKVDARNPTPIRLSFCKKNLKFLKAFVLLKRPESFV